MKKTVAFLLAGSVLAGCSFNVKLPPLTTSSASATNNVDLLEISITQSNSAANTDVAISELTYPKFAPASGDAEVGNLIADQLNESVATTVEDFKVFAADSYMSDSPEMKSSILVEVRKNTADAKLMKFEILTCEYLAGAAHGNCVGESFIFDAATANRISLWDEISPANEAAFLDYVTAEIFSQLNAEELFSRDEVREYLMAESFINWWPYPDAITVTFSAYAIAPYASGEQEIYLDLEQIESFLKQNSQLPQFLS